jgi:LPS sulfotransferase NodH
MTGDDRPAELPPYDRQQINNLVGLSAGSDLAWKNWFVDQGITPLEVVTRTWSTILRVPCSESWHS